MRDPNPNPNPNPSPDQVAARNQFHLFDEEERDRGSVMYPQASMINHSCVPNCAMTARGRHLVLEAISEVRS